MPTTMELLSKALDVPNAPSAAEWCRRLGVNRTALSVCRARGRLSPTLAGSIAAELGEDPQKWITVAALEAEPETAAKRNLLKRLSARVQKLYLSTRHRLSGGKGNRAA